MSSQTISAENLGQVCGNIAATCDSLELESVIRQLEIVLRFARARSLMGTKLDQRLRAAMLAEQGEDE